MSHGVPTISDLGNSIFLSDKENPEKIQQNQSENPKGEEMIHTGFASKRLDKAAANEELQVE